jgi:phage/plasmid-like protein (TIGR03299 family)
MNETPRITAWQASGLMIRGDQPLTLDQVFNEVPEIGSPVKQYPVIANGSASEEFIANVRETDNRILGVVGTRYRVVQNRDAFQFGADILDQSGSIIDSVGVINGGSVVWFALKLDHHVTIGGREQEAIDTYLLISNGHDGKHGITAAVVPLRLSCNNQLAWAIGSAQRKFTVRHTSGLEGRLYEARRALEVSYKYTDEIVQIGERLIQEPIVGSVDDFLTKVIRLPDDPSDRQITIAENRRAAIHSTLLHAPDLDGIRDTKWGLLQAVSDWETHDAQNRSSAQNSREQQRMARLLTADQRYSTRALNLLTA